ncbi:MAG: sugar ABC transporter permease [Chloroflexi bacterium]|nr:MAG: sugar ABC transporter permease [Chloroflexota bacterium]
MTNYTAIEDRPFSRMDAIRAFLAENGMLVLFLLPAVIVLVITQGYPLGYSAYFSLRDWTLARSPHPGPFVGLDNYSRAIEDSVFTGSVETTITFALLATAFELIVGFTLAYLTVGENFWLQIGRTILIMPMVIAPVAVGTMWRMMYSARAGLINHLLRQVGIDGPDWLGDPSVALTSLIIVDVWEWSPFVMVIYAAAITSLPNEPFRAARVDGASRWQIFRHITLPLLMPVTLLVLMFRLIDTLLTLDIVVTTTFGGPGFRTHTLSFWIYQQGLRYFNISYAAATSWMMLIGCLLVAIVLLVVRQRVTHWQG